MKSLERILKARLNGETSSSGRSFNFGFSRYSLAVAKYKSRRRHKRAPLKREICLCLRGTDLAGGGFFSFLFFTMHPARPCDRIVKPDEDGWSLDGRNTRRIFAEYFYERAAEIRGESADPRTPRAHHDRVPFAVAVFPRFCPPLGAHRRAIIGHTSENPGHPFPSACCPRHKYRPRTHLRRIGAPTCCCIVPFSIRPSSSRSSCGYIKY